MNTITEDKLLGPNEEGLDFKKIFYILLSKWYLVVVSVAFILTI
jgi:hypothetical protein